MKLKLKERIALIVFTVVLMLFGRSISDAQMANAATETISEEFRYTIYAGKVTINKYLGTAEEVEIPRMIEGCPVIAIGDDAFNGCNIKAVKIPDTITHIGGGAFYNTALETVTIPGTAQITGHSFANCKNLKEVIIEHGATVIYGFAFHKCSSLEKVSLPESLLIIGEDAFSECLALEEIELPESVITIGKGAFANCPKLKKIDLPDGVSNLYQYVFLNCSSLEDITLPRGLIQIHYAAFEGCTSLKHLEIPKSIKRLWDGAFWGSALETITIEEGASLGLYEWTIWGVHNLKYFTLPSDITYFDNGVFSFNGGVFRVPEGSNTHKLLKNDHRYNSRFELIPATEQLVNNERIEAEKQMNKIAEAQIGDMVVFGSYEQDNNSENGKEAVEWQILDKKDGKVLLLSKYALDACPYNFTSYDITWKDSYIRQWMNGNMFWNLFNDWEADYVATTNLKNENNPIKGTNGGGDTQDKLFLLSYSDVITYFNALPETCDEARQAKATTHVKQEHWVYNNAKIGAFKNNTYDGNCSWWLRTPGARTQMAACVNYMGGVDPWGSYVYAKTKAVRPAMWIKVEAE